MVCYLSLHFKTKVHNIFPTAPHAKRNLQLPKGDSHLHLINLVSPLACAAVRMQLISCRISSEDIETRVQAVILFCICCLSYFSYPINLLFWVYIHNLNMHSSKSISTISWLGVHILTHPLGLCHLVCKLIQWRNHIDCQGLGIGRVNFGLLS